MSRRPQGESRCRTNPPPLTTAICLLGTELPNIIRLFERPKLRKQARLTKHRTPTNLLDRDVLNGGQNNRTNNRT